MIALVNEQPIPDVVFFTMRMEPALRLRFVNFIRAEKMNVPKMEVGLRAAEGFYGTATETAEKLYSSLTSLWRNVQRM